MVCALDIRIGGKKKKKKKSLCSTYRWLLCKRRFEKKIRFCPPFVCIKASLLQSCIRKKCLLFNGKKCIPPSEARYYGAAKKWPVRPCFCFAVSLVLSSILRPTVWKGNKNPRSHHGSRIPHWQKRLKLKLSQSLSSR